jgi:hypothetical protein
LKLGSLSVASYIPQGYGIGILTRQFRNEPIANLHLKDADSQKTAHLRNHYFIAYARVPMIPVSFSYCLQALEWATQRGTVAVGKYLYGTPLEAAQVS